MAARDPSHTAPSPQASPPKPKALIVISSGRTLPLAQPSGHPGISTGFFLIEMPRCCKASATTSTWSSPPPTAGPRSWTSTGWRSTSTRSPAWAPPPRGRPWPRPPGSTSPPSGSGARSCSPAATPSWRPPTSCSASSRSRSPFPNTDKEAKLLRDDIVTAFAALPEHPYHSARELVERNRDPHDPLELRDFAFVHMPGGHAPMIDFVDNPYLGELLNSLHEDGVLISLICHAPVAMVSAKYRVAADGEISRTSDHHFKGARLTTVPKHAELVALTTAYPKVPGHKTRLAYYVDEALKEAGYQVETKMNPAAAHVVYDDKAKLLTGNGPQAIDDQAAKLRELLDGAKQGRPATTRTPA